MNDVDRFITTNSLNMVKAGLSNLAVIAGKYPDVVTRLAEIVDLVKEIQAFADDETSPFLIPRDQNSKMN